MATEPDLPVTVRPATIAEADAVAEVYLAAYRATYDFPLAHSDEAIRAWLRDAVAAGGVWVAVAADDGDHDPPGGQLVGFLRLVGQELDQLYVAPGWWRRGPAPPGPRRGEAVRRAR